MKKRFLTTLVVPVIASILLFSPTALANEANNPNKHVNIQFEEIAKLKKAASAKIKKGKIPNDPRGPLPESGDQWEEWLKNHPDPIQSSYNAGTTITGVTPAATTQKQFPLGLLIDGDIVLGARATDSSSSSAPYGYFRHAGMFVSSNNSFISAMPNKGVEWESIYWWETNYGDVILSWVPNATYDQVANATTSAVAHLGEPYDWQSSKTDTTKWYCSKIPWFQYNKWASIDIDFDGGYWVTPDNIWADDNVAVYWRG